MACHAIRCSMPRANNIVLPPTRAGRPRGLGVTSPPYPVAALPSALAVGVSLLWCFPAGYRGLCRWPRSDICCWGSPTDPSVRSA